MTGYLEDWDRRCRLVYQRNEYTCQNCGRRGGPYGDVELHAHHVVPKGRGGSHRVSNLVTLCGACHRAVHNRSAVAPTAGQADAGSGVLTSLYSAYQTWKRIRRLF
jgi:5-methylcytosine-specific restriction protein A